MFQIPVPPLQRSDDLSNEHHLWMNEPDQPSEVYLEKGIPTLFTWNYGGNVVLVEGSWDNWASRYILFQKYLLASGIFPFIQCDFILLREIRTSNCATLRKPMQRSGKDHTLLMILPSGVYQYRFLVDGQYKCIPDLPRIADEMGNAANLLDVHVSLFTLHCAYFFSSVNCISEKGKFCV